MPIIFFNIGWMSNYRGIVAGDAIRHGGAWVVAQGTGHEIYNFAPYRGRYYGSVQQPGAGIALERLGGSLEDEWLDDVTVVWTAKHPQRRLRVVGWYERARLYRYRQTAPAGAHRKMRGERDAGFFAVANVKTARLLAPDNRPAIIPRNRPGSMGQSNVWYADSSLGRKTIAKVERLIASAGAPTKKTSRPARTTDPEHKAKVEAAAVRKAFEHYEALGFHVESVEKDNRGWDLFATRAKERLCIEVKGLSGRGPMIEVTPNEFAQMSSRRIRASYRICIVTEALSRKPQLRLFEPRGKVWIDQFDAVMEEQVVRSARLTWREVE